MRSLYYTGRGRGWRDVRNWSRETGGAACGARPSPSDRIVLDANSGTGDVSLVGVPHAGISISGYRGSVTLPSGGRIDCRAAPKPGRRIRPRVHRLVGRDWLGKMRRGLATVTVREGVRPVVVPTVSGGATTTAVAAGGNWNAAGTWDTAAVPTAADDTRLAATSGNVTINAAAVCRSLDCTGYTGTLTHSATFTLTVGDATAGAGSIALKLVSTMTYTLGSATTSAISFASTSATVQTVEAAGKTLGNVTFGSGASAGSWQLTDGFTTGSGATVTHSRGAFDTNGTTNSWGLFQSTSGLTRTLTLGASQITLTATAVTTWSMSNTIGLTFNAGTSSLVFSTTGSGQTMIVGTSQTFYDLTFQGNNGTGQITGSFSTTVTCHNFSYTGGASKTALLSLQAQLVVQGTLTLGGNSTRGVNRLLVQSIAVGTQRTITAAAIVINGDVDFADINLAYSGATSWTNAGNAYIGDAGGNAGAVTTNATASATQTWGTNSSSNWSIATWTSRVPLPQDDVIINQAFVAASQITADMPRWGRSIDFTGTTGAPTLSFNNVNSSMYGSLTLVANVVLSSGAGRTFNFAGRGNYSVTTAGLTFPNTVTAVSFNAPVNTYTLSDDWLGTWTGTLALGYGTLVATGRTLNVGSFNGNPSAGIGVRTFTITNATINLAATGTTTSWNASGGNLTLNAAGSTVKITSTDSAVTKTFAGGGLTYGTFQHSSTGTAALVMTGNNTFANFDVESNGSARTFTLPANGTQIVTGNLTLVSSGGTLSLASSTPGTATTIQINLSGGSWPITMTAPSLSADVKIVGILTVPTGASTASTAAATMQATANPTPGSSTGGAAAATMQGAINAQTSSAAADTPGATAAAANPASPGGATGDAPAARVEATANATPGLATGDSAGATELATANAGAATATGATSGATATGTATATAGQAAADTPGARIEETTTAAAASASADTPGAGAAATLTASPAAATADSPTARLEEIANPTAARADASAPPAGATAVANTAPGTAEADTAPAGATGELEAAAGAASADTAGATGAGSETTAAGTADADAPPASPVARQDATAASANAGAATATLLGALQATAAAAVASAAAARIEETVTTAAGAATATAPDARISFGVEVAAILLLADRPAAALTLAAHAAATLTLGHRRAADVILLARAYAIVVLAARAADLELTDRATT